MLRARAFKRQTGGVRQLETVKSIAAIIYLINQNIWKTYKLDAIQLERG